MTGENGNTAEGITKEKILNQPLLEEGTFLSYASKVMCTLRIIKRSYAGVSCNEYSLFINLYEKFRPISPTLCEHC